MHNIIKTVGVILLCVVLSSTMALACAAHRFDETPPTNTTNHTDAQETESIAVELIPTIIPPTIVTEPTEPPVVINTNGDILFIGNSLTEGLRLVSNTNNKFICKVGVSLDGLNLSSMYSMDFKVVIINMGTNEIGAYTEEHFKASYIKLINEIREYNPDAQIICCSIPPILQTGCYAEQYNNTNAKLYTKYIKTIAETCNVDFLDNAEFFGEELIPDWTGDGLHFYGNIYQAWYEFLINSIGEEPRISRFGALPYRLCGSYGSKYGVIECPSVTLYMY